MKNRLIPLTKTNKGYEPVLVGHGHIYRTLVKAPEGGRCTKHDHQGFSFRRDLHGKVVRCEHLPVIEIDDGSVYAVMDPDNLIRSCWVY